MGALAGKVAVVTGGGSGIGLASATRLAEAGVSVAVVDLDGDSAEEAAGGSEASGCRPTWAARRCGPGSSTR